jgi:nucleotide-binding universal stress UspA family protein
MYDCILVSLDGSTESEAVLPEVENLLRVHPGKVILLRVGPPVNLNAAAHAIWPEVALAGQLSSEEFKLLCNAPEQQIRRYLEAIADRLAATGATVVTEVNFNRPDDEIIFYAEHYKVDLIVMATHGRTGVNRMLHGSVTESVLHRAPCPVLVVRTLEKPQPRFAERPAETELHTAS